ncbi:MAG: hypothetical protein ACRC8W_20960 [Plesiomonas shigelloides]
MTLLELLVQELPNRGGWPQWAATAVQGDWKGEKCVSFTGCDYRLRHNANGWTSSFPGGTWGKDSHHHSDFTASTLASDHATRIVTREEYERAAAIKASEDMVKSAIQRLTDAVSVQIDKLETGGSSVPRRPVVKVILPGEVCVTNIKCEIVEPSVDGGFSAGYTATRDLKQGEAVRATDIAPLTPLQRIEQLRKARDEALRAYNDAFVSGEAELRKLKLGDKVMFRADKNPSTLVETKIEGDIHGITGRKWVFRDDRTGESRHILTPVNPISFQFVKL